MLEPYTILTLARIRAIHTLRSLFAEEEMK
jgi:hypothetical protein